MKRLSNLQDITDLMRPYFEESALAGDRTRIWVPQDVYDRYKDCLLEFWDIVYPKSLLTFPPDRVKDNEPVLYRGIEVIVREDMSDEKQD